MGRPSNREQRRDEILRAFALVLSKHGYAGATMVSVAEKAGLSPGLLHHHFADKKEMLLELAAFLMKDFRRRLPTEATFTLEDYLDAALKLDARADSIAAKCWVSLLAEALRDPGLMEKIKRFLDSEIESIQRISNNRLKVPESSAVLSYIVGALVFGAFAPKRTSGFAADMGKKMITSL